MFATTDSHSLAMPGFSALLGAVELIFSQKEERQEFPPPRNIGQKYWGEFGLPNQSVVTSTGMDSSPSSD